MLATTVTTIITYLYIDKTVTFTMHLKRTIAVLSETKLCSQVLEDTEILFYFQDMWAWGRIVCFCFLVKLIPVMLVLVTCFICNLR